jgi:hypothetical protein
VLATVLAVLITACSPVAPLITPSSQPTVPDNTAPQSTPTPTATATATATPTVTPSMPTRTVTSDDGRVTVSVPLTEPLADQVSVRAMSVDESPQELKDAGVPQPCYELLPAEATFSSPVTITSTWPAASDLGALRFFFHIIRAPAGTWAWLDNSSITYTDEAVTVTGTTTHFSTLCRFTDRTDLFVDPKWPRVDLIGVPFTRFVSIRSLDQRPNPITLFGSRVADVEGPIRVAEPTRDDEFSFSQLWTCEDVGEYTATVEIDVLDFGADNPFYTDQLKVAKIVEAGIVLVMNGMCVDRLADLELQKACIQVVHEALDDFLSFLLMWLIFGEGEDLELLEFIEVVVTGANDNEPVRLEVRGEGRWEGVLGLRGAGPKSLQRVTAHFSDGKTLDLTDAVAERLGGRNFNVPFPEEPTFGSTCDSN